MNTWRNWWKAVLSFIMFVAGLQLFLGQNLEPYNNSWWHTIGFALLACGLEEMFKTYKEETKAEMRKEMDEKIEEKLDRS